MHERIFVKLVFPFFRHSSFSSNRLMHRQKKVNEMRSFEFSLVLIFRPRYLAVPSLFSLHNYYFHQSILNNWNQMPFLFFSFFSLFAANLLRKKSKKNTWTQQEMKTSNNSERVFFYFWGNRTSWNFSIFTENAALQIKVFAVVLSGWLERGEEAKGYWNYEKYRGIEKKIGKIKFNLYFFEFKIQKFNF